MYVVFKRLVRKPRRRKVIKKKEKCAETHSLLPEEKDGFEETKTECAKKHTNTTAPVTDTCIQLDMFKRKSSNETSTQNIYLFMEGNFCLL